MIFNHVRNMEKFYYTYILQNISTGKFYKGFTHDLRKRFKEHTDGKSTYTKRHGPYKLVYYEACLSKEDAMARELYLKTGRGTRFINERLKRFLFRT